MYHYHKINMKILSAAQLREADQHTINSLPIASVDLMERAARECYNWIRQHMNQVQNFVFFCGTGNNGGDGLALARMLACAGKGVNVFVVRHSSKETEDFSKNFIRLKELKNVTIHDLFENDFAQVLAGQQVAFLNAVCVDAIFGNGLNTKIAGWLKDLVTIVNELHLLVISIDIPSGLFADDNRENDPKAIVRANYTLTFQLPKLAFLLPSYGNCVGRFYVLDIGLDEKYIASKESDYYFITSDTIKNFLKPRLKFSHKGNFGHALLIGGSLGKIGAVVMAAHAALRTGTGLVTAQVPKCGNEIIQSTLPEAMVITDKNPHFISEQLSTENYDAIGIGPGLAGEKDTQLVLKHLIQNSSIGLVIDADAINILAENKTWLSFLPAETILTPHPKEFERLAGKTDNDIAQTKLLKDFAIKHNVFVVLKGAHTRIASPSGNIYFNSTGNAGLAKGGSGDVLTGIITALLAQGYTPLQSALTGVYLHGLAADLLLENIPEESMMARDIIENIAKAFTIIKA